MSNSLAACMSCFAIAMLKFAEAYDMVAIYAHIGGVSTCQWKAAAIWAFLAHYGALLGLLVNVNVNAEDVISCAGCGVLL